MRDQLRGRIVCIHRSRYLQAADVAAYIDEIFLPFPLTKVVLEGATLAKVLEYSDPMRAVYCDSLIRNPRNMLVITP